MLYTHAKFSIQGYVGAIREVGKTLKIRISTKESWKDRESGERKDRESWNTVTMFERTPGFGDHSYRVQLDKKRLWWR